jgi:hypothetical protein
MTKTTVQSHGFPASSEAVSRVVAAMQRESSDANAGKGWLFKRSESSIGLSVIT